MEWVNAQTGDEPTEISNLLWRKTGLGIAAADWEPAKSVLGLPELEPDSDLGDDAVVERILDANVGEVLHTFALDRLTNCLHLRAFGFTRQPEPVAIAALRT